MKPTLVTGATGFLGWHVARLLLERGHPVRCLTRGGKPVRELDAEVVAGDLRDAASVTNAAAGCGLIFHVAADYRLWAKDTREMYSSNVEGTRNILLAARAAGVERTVYTSTVGCIGVPPGGIGDEQQSVQLSDMVGAYKRSKFLAEQVALEEARAGLPVVIVNPTAPVGDHDTKPTPTGKIVLDFLKGDLPAYLDTGLNVVDAADTALGHLLAAEKGRVGERYILGSENLTLQQILVHLEEVSGRPAPKIQIPYAIAWAAGAFSTSWARLSGQEPRVAFDAVRMAKKKMWVTHAKAERELGFRPQPARVGLAKAVEWFRANGYV